MLLAGIVQLTVEVGSCPSDHVLERKRGMFSPVMCDTPGVRAGRWGGGFWWRGAGGVGVAGVGDAVAEVPFDPGVAGAKAGEGALGAK